MTTPQPATKKSEVKQQVGFKCPFKPEVRCRKPEDKNCKQMDCSVWIETAIKKGKMKFQFVNWFPKWRGFYWFRWHKEKSAMAYIYDWFLGFAFWEIRKWHKLKDGELSHDHS